MTRLLPKSLVGQLLWLVALALLIAQGVNMLLLYRSGQYQNLAAATSTAVGRIANDLERLERPAKRHRGGRRGFERAKPMVSEQSLIDAEMTRLSDLEDRATEAFANMGLNIQAVEIARVEKLPQGLSSDIVINRMRAARRGQMDRAMGRQHKRGLVAGYALISVQTADGQWTSIAAAIHNRGPYILWRLLFQTVVLYLILLVPLILLGRYVSRPLKALTAGAENFQPDEANIVPEAGPPDVRRLIAAFNAMNVRVSGMLNEKDVMLGAIGHDLRTPLAALRVRVENVEDDRDREQMIAGIEDMDAMLDDILSLARIGRSGEVAEQTDIAALVETVVNEFVDIGDEVTFERGARVTAKLRPILIKRALRNLVENAVKYGGSATVSVEKSVDKLLIHVDDKGDGIAEEDIEKMFTPFARAEKSRNRKTGGSGLGLTLARAIAREHGGDIVIANKSSGGLRATLHLAV